MTNRWQWASTHCVHWSICNVHHTYPIGFVYAEIRILYIQCISYNVHCNADFIPDWPLTIVTQYSNRDTAGGDFNCTMYIQCTCTLYTLCTRTCGCMYVCGLSRGQPSIYTEVMVRDCYPSFKIYGYTYAHLCIIHKYCL